MPTTGLRARRSYLVPCTDCRRARALRSSPTSDTCASCAAKRAYKNGRKGPASKDWISTTEIIALYEAGQSLPEIGRMLGITPRAVKMRIEAGGGKTRTLAEANQIAEAKYGCLAKARASLNAKIASGEYQKACSARQQGIPLEEWTEFVTPDWITITKADAYKAWRSAVLHRDQFRCVVCGDKRGRFQAHHIQPKAKYPELAFDVANGACLCKDCHNAMHGKESLLAESILFLINSRRA